MYVRVKNRVCRCHYDVDVAAKVRCCPEEQRGQEWVMKVSQERRARFGNGPLFSASRVHPGQASANLQRAPTLTASSSTLNTSLPECLISRLLPLPFKPPEQFAKEKCVTSPNGTGTFPSLVDYTVSKRGPRATVHMQR